MAAEGMQSHDQSCGNCPMASHPATKKGRINAPILPKPARCAKADRLLEVGDQDLLYLNQGTEVVHRVLFDAGISHEYRLVEGAEHVGASLGPRFLDAFGVLGRPLHPAR